MTRVSVVLALAVTFALAGCSGDPTTTPTPTGGTGGTATASCEQLASESAQAHGDRIFVEAGGAQYTVDAVRSLPDDRVIVETTVDQPDLVGYGQVWFLSECTADELILLGGYIPANGTFELLFTTNESEGRGDIPYVAP